MKDEGARGRSANSPLCPLAGCDGVVIGVMRTSGFGVAGGFTIGRSLEAQISRDVLESGDGIWRVVKKVISLGQFLGRVEDGGMEKSTEYPCRLIPPDWSVSYEAEKE